MLLYTSGKHCSQLYKGLYSCLFIHAKGFILKSVFFMIMIVILVHAAICGCLPACLCILSVALCEEQLPFKGQNLCGKPGPRLLCESPKVNVSFPEKDMGEEEGALDSLASVKVFGEDVTMRFPICGISCTLVSQTFSFDGPESISSSQLLYLS